MEWRVGALVGIVGMGCGPSAGPPMMDGTGGGSAGESTLDDGTLDGASAGAVRCWGNNVSGQLGYGHEDAIGDDETPASAGDVPLQ